MKNKKYNVVDLFSGCGGISAGFRNTGRVEIKGAISKYGLVVSASRLLLYDSNPPKDYQVFELDSSSHIIAKNDLMKSKGYPDVKPDREYLLYVITEEAEVKPYFDVESLRQTYAPKLRKGSPFFVTI